MGAVLQSSLLYYTHRIRQPTFAVLQQRLSRAYTHHCVEICSSSTWSTCVRTCRGNAHTKAAFVRHANNSAPCQHLPRTKCRAAPLQELSVALLEESPVWTLDQIAGLAFGGLMLASVLLATKVDVIIARAQRRDLGLCEECGGVFDSELCNSGQCPSKTRQ